MQTNSAAILNNNNVTTKNLQVVSAAAAVAGPNHSLLPPQSMSPALGGSGAATGGGLVTVTKTLNQGAAVTPTSGQNLVAGVQLVNLRSGAPTTIQPTGSIVQQPQAQSQAAQRTVATVQPRVVIGSQNVMTTANRPATNQVSVRLSWPAPP